MKYKPEWIKAINEMKDAGCAVVIIPTEEMEGCHPHGTEQVLKSMFRGIKDKTITFDWEKNEHR